MKNDLLLIRGDARRLPLADESVQCIVTSPPYWGLRKYAGAQELIWDGLGGDGLCVTTNRDGRLIAKRESTSGHSRQCQSTNGGGNPAERKNEPGHFL